MPTKTPAEHVNQIATAYQQSQLLFTAVRAGVFDLLEESRSAAEIALALQWEERSARILLDALTAAELLEKHGGRYQNGVTASSCLVKGAKDYQGHIIQHAAHSWESYQGMEEAMKAGGPPGGPRRERTTAELRSFILGMDDIGRGSAQQLAKAVDFSKYLHLLDLGGGPATYPMVLVSAYPQLRATLFDRPDVIEIAKEQVEAGGLTDKIDFIPGDFMADPLGVGYDAILVSNIIHSYGTEENQRLVEKCAEALSPGGVLIVKDFFPNDERSGPPFALLFALHMFLHTEQGGTYTLNEVASWTREAGLEDGELIPVAVNSGAWIAHKPG